MALLWVGISIGTLASAAALYGRYRVLPSRLTGPNICRLEDGGCRALFRTRQAALLGIPNSALALAYYGLLGVGLLRDWPIRVLWTASCLAILMSAWLAWILMRDRLECRICWTGHVCNALIWILLLARLISI